jgi:hypothetical protein
MTDEMQASMEVPDDDVAAYGREWLKVEDRIGRRPLEALGRNLQTGCNTP